MTDKKSFKSAHLISIAVDPVGRQMYLHLDKAGLDHLLDELHSLRDALEHDEAPHTHLFGPSNGSDELSETMLSSESDEGCFSIIHLKVYAWSDDWHMKHCL
jgi:hypothetical protein